MSIHRPVITKSNQNLVYDAKNLVFPCFIHGLLNINACNFLDRLCNLSEKKCMYFNFSTCQLFFGVNNHCAFIIFTQPLYGGLHVYLKNE